jgi:HEAT repeat protein
MPDVCRAFPGRAVAAVDNAATVAEALRQSAFFRLLARLGRDQCAPLVAHAIDDDDRHRRFAAVVAARALELGCCLPGLGRRLTDPEARVAVAAIEAVAALRTEPGAAAVLARMRDLCRRGHDPERRFAIRAVAALADQEAVPVLIDLVGARPRDLAEEARAALAEICRQDFGAAERRWRAWYTEHQAAPRRRWLLMALVHKEHALRAAAAAELREGGVALLGYEADGSAGDRQDALVRLCAVLDEPVPQP